MLISNAFDSGLPILAALASSSSGDAVRNEFDTARHDQSTTKSAIPIAELLPPVSLFADASHVQETAEYVVDHSRSLHWLCQYYLHEDNIRVGNLTWNIEVTELVSELKDRCTEMFLLEHRHSYANFQTTARELELGNDTLTYYHETGMLAADDFLKMHRSELERKHASVLAVLAGHQRWVHIAKPAYGAARTLRLMCLTCREEECWSTSEHRKIGLEADGSWTTNAYQQALDQQRRQLDTATFGFTMWTHYDVWSQTPHYEHPSAIHLVPMEKILETRIHNVSAVLSMDYAQEPKPVVQLLLATMQSGTPVTDPGVAPASSASWMIRVSIYVSGLVDAWV